MGKYQFVIGRQGDDVLVTLPIVCAIITLVMTVPPHHNPMACNALGQLAALITEDEITSTTKEPAGGPIHLAIGMYKKSHPEDGQRFEVRGGYIMMRLHPTELAAIAESLKHMLLVKTGGQGIDETIEVWITAAEKFVSWNERFAVDVPPGKMVS